MDHDEEQQAVVRAFVEDSQDQLSIIEAALVALEAQPHDEQLLRTLMRSAHTVKGNASMVGFSKMTDVAHLLESALERAQPVSHEQVGLLLQVVDLLRHMVPIAVAGHEHDQMPPSAEALLQELARLGEAPIAAAPVAAPAAEPVVDAAPVRAPTLRVGMAKLDRLLALAGEILIARGRLAQLLADGASHRELADAHQATEPLDRELHEVIMQARLVPIGPTLRQNVRAVRDQAARFAKLARLVLDGEDVEVDAMVVNLLRDPLTHLIRNALDHGIESPGVRRSLGKDPYGTIRLAAARQGKYFVLRISDDGAGLDRERIRERAVEKGVLAADAQVSDHDLLRLIFEAGLSTADVVTELSGRGIGMDVVKRNVEALRGSILIDSSEGQGTTFTLRVPLTLAIIGGFLVGAGDQTYVLPLDSVVECAALDYEALMPSDDGGVVNVHGAPLPCVRLRQLFGLGGTPPTRENLVIIEHETERAALAVDVLQGESQTVVRPLGKLFNRLAGVSGAAILESGRVALILDVPELFEQVFRPRLAAAPGR